MATRLGDALLMLGADDDKLKKDLGDAEQKTKGWGATMTGVLQGIGQGAVGAIGGLISGAWDTFTESIDLASDLNETISKVRTLFGDASLAIEDWASGAAMNLGMTKQAALDAVGSIGNVFLQLGEDAETAAGTSQALVQLATDLGSFHNADPTEILDSMSAAFRGEYDALQKYVPMINAANVEQRALADTGKSAASELTALDKATAAYELTVEGAGAATGDFARTSDGWANTMKTLNAYWTEFKTLLGETLLPVLAPILEKVKDLANQYLPMLADYIHDNVIPAIEAWGAQFDGWWAAHAQPFIDDVKAMWDDVVSDAAESQGTTQEDFKLNLEGMLAIAQELGKRIGTGLADAITGELSTQFSEWAANIWPHMVKGLIDNVSWLAMLQQLGVIKGPLQNAPATPTAPSAPPLGAPSTNYQTHIPIVINAQGANANAVAQAANNGVTQALRAAGVTP